MANEKNDISDIVKTCKILLLDIEGTTTSISFVKDKLFPYAEENVKDFLDNEWESENVKEAVTALRKLALEDAEKNVDGVVAIPGEDASKEDQIEGLVKNVKWQMSLDRKVGPLKQLQGLVWSEGYDKGDIKGHVYDDVSPALELWRATEGQKVYIYSSGSVQAQKLLFSKSSAGDMLKLIDGHFDTAVGAKQEAASYTAIVENIGCKAEEVLFLTDIDKEAEAAKSAGVHVALVSREGNAPLTEAITSAYPVIHSFAELTVSKKRKPDDQEEPVPAKVPKTDVEADVKTTIETQTSDSPKSVTTPPKEKPEEPEKMEVEEEAPAKEDIPNGQPNENVEKAETTVEEITDVNAAADIPDSDTKPIIEESSEKTDQQETELMETEPVQVESPPSECKQNGNKGATVPEETPPVVITEIKDVTNEKDSLNGVSEIDIVPVVEEPPAQDMEELQNVGEVLDKECDEILSKVEDVTNLDNMPSKPLQSIAEETMETENTDSNDIVEGILDSEQELEKKQAESKEVNTAEEISEVKTDTDKCELPSKSPEVQKEAPSENIAEESKVTETVKETETTASVSSPVEEKVEETSTKTDETDSCVPTGKKAEELSQTEEKVQESNVSEEKVAESTEESAKETSVTEEKVNAKDSIKPTVSEEPVAAASVTDETQKEKSITEEVTKDITEEQKVEETSLAETKPEEDKVPVEEVKPTTQETTEEHKMETEESKATPVENVTEDKSVTDENKVVEDKELPKETSEDKPVENSMEVDSVETPVETEKVAAESTTTEVQKENDTKEPQVNGNATNGDVEMVNGDSRKEEELNSRLSMENGKEVVNGANGDSVDGEAKCENNGDDIKDVADIKVKTVAVEEPNNDPIEQPTEV